MRCSLLSWLFSVEEGDVAGLHLSGGAAFCTLCSYFYLQPLSDALALQVGIRHTNMCALPLHPLSLSDTLALQVGIRLTPLITVANIVVIVMLNGLYGVLVQRQPVTSIVYTVYSICIALLLLFALLFTAFPVTAPTPPPPPSFPQPPSQPQDFQSLPGSESIANASQLLAAAPWAWTHLYSIVSFIFCVLTGTISLFLTTTFWGRMASLHTKEEAKRVYGVIAAGAQVIESPTSPSSPLDTPPFELGGPTDGIRHCLCSLCAA